MLGNVMFLSPLSVLTCTDWVTYENTFPSGSLVISLKSVENELPHKDYM